MLVLSRKPGQKLIVGEDIHFTIISMEGSRVTIGIEAPRDKRILRGELTELADVPLVIEVPITGELPTPTHPPERTFL